MHKLATFLRAGPAADRAGFRAWVHTTAAPDLLARRPDIRHAILDLVDVDPADAEWVRPGEPRPAAPPSEPAYDAVLETWVEPADEAVVLAELAAVLGPRAAEAWTYRLTERIEKQDRPRHGPGRSPGVKYLVQCRFFDDLPASAAQRSWANHAKLALRVHVGMDTYIRNWVDAALTPSAPRVDGIGELHFPSFEDMRDRWFCSEQGRAAIVQDIGHFLQSGTRLYTSEYVLR